MNVTVIKNKITVKNENPFNVYLSKADLVNYDTVFITYEFSILDIVKTFPLEKDEIIKNFNLRESLTAKINVIEASFPISVGVGEGFSRVYLLLYNGKKILIKRDINKVFNFVVDSNASSSYGPLYGKSFCSPIISDLMCIENLMKDIAKICKYIVVHLLI